MEIKELDRQISNGSIGRLYFFYGSEQFLMEHKLKSIKNRLVDGDFKELNHSLLDGKKITAADIARETAAVPVMADRRMVVVKNSGIFSNAKTADFAAVCKLIGELPDYLCLIFTEREFDKKKEKNLDTLKKHGEAVKFDPLSEVQLERWLEKLFEDNGKTILRCDISTMLSLCGQNMAVLFNETAKLLSYIGEHTKITAEDIASVVSKSTEARIFDVIDNIALGKSKNVFDELYALKSMGENPSTVLSLISSRLGELLTVKQLISDKMSRDKIAEYLEPKRPAFVVGKLEEQGRRLSEDYLIKMTLKGPEYTAAVRSGKLDKWAAVEMYALELLNH